MKTIEVVAAIIKKGDQIFATQRGYGDWKDWWEFPGGKVEPGESPVQALRREIREELDTEISADKFLTTIEWDYPAFHLTMHCYMCSLLSEALHLNEHEAARWLGADELRSVQWLPADDQLLPLIEQELSTVVKENKAMKELTIQEIETIVKRDENRIMEAKKTTGELAAGMQSGCAFLNTEGGWLFFGIHPQKLTLLGQDVADQTRQDIANAFRKFSPAIDLSAQYIEVPDKPGKYVIAIYFKAPKAFEAPYTYDGRPWYKVENTTAQMPREMFDERIRLSDPEKFSWEKTMLPGATDKDISNKRLVDVINAGINKGRIPASAASLRSIDQRLDHFNLRTAEGYLTNAAIALFGKNPTRKISQCELKLARFEGTNMRVFRDQIVCEGNLFDQYDAILDFCRKHMFLSGTMDQKERIDTLTVPYKVIREAALNILIHRTWWSSGNVLSVAIFDDRVEFANPGAFPPGTSPESFYRRPQSQPINKLISEVFFKSGLMEAWGRGIPDIFDLCKESGLPKPEFELANGYVYLTIRFKQSLTPYLSGGVNEPQNEPLNGPLNETLNLLPSPVKTVYDAVKTNPGIRRAGIVAHTGLNLPAVKRAITVLLSKELIEHRGSDKTGGYYVI